MKKMIRLANQPPGGVMTREQESQGNKSVPMP